MVATQNIETLGPIWTFSLRSVLTFVAYQRKKKGLPEESCWAFLHFLGWSMHTMIVLIWKKSDFHDISL